MDDRKPIKISVHQPGYHRYLGFFKKILESDIFVIFDTVQYVPREWQNRQKFIHNGKDKWLSVPVNKGRDLIKNKKIVNGGWQKSHFEVIKNIYKNAPYWGEHEKFFREYYTKKYDSLEPLCSDQMRYVLDRLQIKTQIFRASDFEKKETYSFHKGALLSQLILDLVEIEPSMDLQRLIYLSGTGALTYMGSEDETGKKQIDYFTDRNIEVEYSEFHPTEYRQCFGGGRFVPYLSVFDALLNIGDRETRNLISKNDK